MSAEQNNMKQKYVDIQVKRFIRDKKGSYIEILKALSGSNKDKISLAENIMGDDVKGMSTFLNVSERTVIRWRMEVIKN